MSGLVPTITLFVIVRQHLLVLIHPGATVFLFGWLYLFPKLVRISLIKQNLSIRKVATSLLPFWVLSVLVFSSIFGFIKLVGRRLMSLPGVQNIFEMESFESTILDFVCVSLNKDLKLKLKIDGLRSCSGWESSEYTCFLFYKGRLGRRLTGEIWNLRNIGEISKMGREVGRVRENQECFRWGGFSG